MASTPMHVALYNAFGWPTPDFGHVPLLVDKNGQKLSKRNADTNISFYRETECLLPAALVNFAALLGWSHSQKSDVFTLDELEQIFTPKITKGNTVVAFEKLWYLQKAHAQIVAFKGGPRFDEIVERISTAAEKRWTREILQSLLQGRKLNDHVALLFRADAKSYINTNDFLSRNATFFTSTIQRPEYTPASNGNSSSSVPLSALHTVAAALSLVPESHWTIEAHRSNISSYDGATAILDDKSSGASEPFKLTNETDWQPTSQNAAADKIFKKELYHYLRWALSAGASGPGIPETMAILGRKETLRRLDEARQLSPSSASQPRLANRLGASQSLEAKTKKTSTLFVEEETSGNKTAADCTWMGSLGPR
jgi:glutamyl-tRNA synthetase